jgi:hypothetical protein
MQLEALFGLARFGIHHLTLPSTSMETLAIYLDTCLPPHFIALSLYIKQHLTFWIWLFETLALITINKYELLDELRRDSTQFN